MRRRLNAAEWPSSTFGRRETTKVIAKRRKTIGMSRSHSGLPAGFAFFLVPAAGFSRQAAGTSAAAGVAGATALEGDGSWTTVGVVREASAERLDVATCAEAGV